MWALWLVGLLLMPGARVLQRLTALQIGTVSYVRIASLIAFLLIVLAWTWPVRRLRNRMLALTVLLAFGVQVLTSAALHSEDLVASTRMAAATVVQAVVTLACYRWRIGDDNLAPHRPHDIIDLMLSSIVGASVVIPLGLVPGVWLTSTAYELLWWGALSSAYVFVGSACIMLLVQRRPRTEAIPTRLTDVLVQLLAFGVCLGVVFTYADLPLKWIMFLPAIWAGLSLGPWASAAYSLIGTVAVLASQVITASNDNFGASNMPNILLLDSLMAAFVFVVLLLSLGRDQQAHDTGEVVGGRQEAVDEAGLLGAAFESINEALVLMDTEGAVLLHNDAALQILGSEKLTTEPGRWLLRREEQSSFAYSFNRHGPEHGVRILAVRLAPVRYAGSDSVVAIVRDVTSEQRRIEELANFAAVAAHDLKTPLAAVQGWMEVAEEALEGETGVAVEALQRGRHATDRMSREIEDWLAYNVAREGVVQPEPIALQPYLDALAADYPDADFVVNTHHTVVVDPTLVRRLLVNLIDNAVKYAQPGERASIAIRSFSAGYGGWVVLRVADTGIGIPSGEETEIFEPFRRASTVEGYEGAGLGLALCKRIVRRHGGLITAQRNEGPGTTITLTLPGAV